MNPIYLNRNRIVRGYNIATGVVIGVSLCLAIWAVML